ncbi:MAG: ABC transporter permease [Microvirga sp.]|nr:ABC transporter permease [Microvirga sp.]
MLPYVIRRIMQLAPIILVIVCVNFVLVRLAPGDPINFLLGDAPASEEMIARLRAEYGLDQPIWHQLLIYIGQVAQGDLGYSFISRADVSTILMSRMPATLLLLGTQFVLSIIFGVLLGVISATRQGTVVDQVVTVLSLVGVAVPAFWLAQMMMLVFSLNLNLFPAQGMRSLREDYEGFAAVVDVARHLALPALTLTIFNLALIARVTRASMINTLRMEYVTFARSKGVSEREVVWVHGLRNAMLPVITVIGLNIPSLIAGAVLTETVFAWPGLGRLTYESIVSRDYPVLLGILIMIGVAVVIANILTDIAYAYFDPRVRYK